MRREDGFSPVAVLVHALGIVAGLVLGVLVASAAAPDLDAGAPQGVVATDEEIAADDASSLFLSPNLSFALDRLREEEGADAEYSLIQIGPGSISTSSTADEHSFTLDEVDADIPQSMIFEIGQARPRVTAEDVAYVQLAAAGDGRRWFLQLSTETDVSPPWTYSAPFAGKPVEGGIGTAEQVAP